ncbi:hypothetical protein N7444_004962 [Penicillium canescens]|nr:hypothetical protein N7444_004962 [Penicillium canescens]
MAPNQAFMAELVILIRHEFRLCMEQNSLMREKWAEVRMLDFNLWVAGMGATAGKKASLDARLQALPDMLSTLKHLLSSLKSTLMDCRRLYGNELEESMEIVDLVIENLAMLATVIRRTGKRSRLRRADLTFDPQRQTRLRRHFECIVLLRPTENALFRPVSSTTIAEDWMSVVPNFAEGSGHLTPLQTRLINANLRRRYWFLCAQRHSDKLARPQTSAGPQASTPRVGTPTISPVEGSVSRPSDTPSSKLASSKGSKHPDKESTLPGLSTVASTVEITNPSAEDEVTIPGVPQTRITAITAAAQYPSLMKSCDDELKGRKILKCPCCCQPQPETMAKNTNAWKKHLVEDIHPYTCIADNCPTPHILYSTRRDWENHVETDHSPNRWVCPICIHTGPIFSGLEALAEHVQDQHGDVFPMDDIHTLLHLGATKSYGLTCCPLCNSSGSLDAPELIDHVLQHTHDFALRALPWPKHRDHARSLPGTYDSKIPNADLVRSWLDDVIEETTDSIAAQLDLRSWDRATQDPNEECSGFDYFEKNDYFADCSSSASLAALSEQSGMHSCTAAVSGLEEAVHRDGLSSAASVIAVIQLTGNLVKLCGIYIQEVNEARDEILTLQGAILGLQGTLQDLQKLLQSNDGEALPTSSRLVSNITDCVFDLRALQARLDLGNRKKLTREMGLRALTWPLKRTEGEGVAQNLERYQSSFLLSLQVDQSSMDLKKLEGAIEAGFESFSDRDEVQCLQGTRTEILHQIMEWAMSPSQKSIFWLKGIAGTGKSTISRTVAKSLEDTNHLGASFFFKRGEGDRGNAKKFFPTLIWQLMLRISELRSSVQKALYHDPNIMSKTLREQFEKLLLQPLLNLDQLGRQPQTAVIVIDALDECEHDHDVRNIIRLLPLLQKAKAVRLRIFLTSRPELPISLGFKEIADYEYQDLALHEISEEVIEHDIHLFLLDRFAKIQHDRNISKDWPGDNIIRELVTMSAPLFISAATICRYIENSEWDPKLRLAEFLTDQAKYISRMDKTYLPILTRLLDDQESDESEQQQQQLLQEFQNTVGVIVLLAVPLSINALSQFLGIGADKISNLLDLFRSVLSIPGDRNQPVRILHLSFQDFLVQSKTKFLVDKPKKHKDIAKFCLKTMRSHLQKDICNLASPRTHRADIDPQHIRQYLPPDLQYSCRYWIHHLEKSQALSSEIEDVRLFLQKHFLHWVEAMSLLGLTSEVVKIINLVQTAILGDIEHELADFLHDAYRFVLKNRQIVDVAPLQLYCSCLVFAPKHSIIRRLFCGELPSWISGLPNTEKDWSAELQTLEGHAGSVRSAAFSPDGQLVASGSTDKAIWLWDTIGTLQQTLEGHSGLVQSVAFSPDGRLIASGSTDETVRLWDTATGSLQQTLEGHSSSVNSVAFSPAGRLLASGSADRTVRLWDTVTGVLQQTFEGHSQEVHSVTFSPNGRLIASGSADETVQLWDTATGGLQQTLEAQSSSVNSVAFSPAGRLLVSGSADRTVRLWDTATGVLQQTFEGHSQEVESVAFSPDGQLLASSSTDRTVRVWDTATGALQQTLEGHSHEVHSVTFSPNGQLLASSSTDRTVRLWNTATGVLQQTLKAKGHLHEVNSVAFSPDGQLLASSSADRTLRLWDTATGSITQILGKVVVQLRQ